MRLSQNQPAAISISCVRTIHAHSVCFDRTLPWWLLAEDVRNEAMCANSRTLDIGKACRLIL